MGVSRSGRFAAVTNYRGAHEPSAPESRGALVSRFLAGSEPPGAYMESLVESAGRYSGFNLLAAHDESLWWFSNRASPPRRLPPGIYGLGNLLLDDPGLDKLKSEFAAVATRAPGTEALFSVVSAAKVVNPAYGTRCSSVWRRGRDGRGRYAERSFVPDGSERETLLFELPLPSQDPR